MQESRYKKKGRFGSVLSYSCLDYAAAMQKKRDNKDSGSGGTRSSNSSNSNVSKDFKIALAAYTSAEDYAALEEQFFQLKE